MRAGAVLGTSGAAALVQILASIISSRAMPSSLRAGSRCPRWIHEHRRRWHSIRTTRWCCGPIPDAAKPYSFKFFTSFVLTARVLSLGVKRSVSRVNSTKPGMAGYLELLVIRGEDERTAGAFQSIAQAAAGMR